MSRRRFKRFALVASAGFTLLTVGVGSVVYDWYATRAEWDAKLGEALARLSADDPDWDAVGVVKAHNAALPTDDGANTGMVIRKALALRPPSFYEREPELNASQSLVVSWDDDRLPHDDDFCWLYEVHLDSAAALAEAKTIVALPTGGFPAHFSEPDPTADLMQHVQELYAGAQLFQDSATVASYLGDGDEALRACRATLHLGQTTLADEPMMISQLVRYATIGMSIGGAQQALAWTEPKAELAALQRAYSGAAETNGLFPAMRGERAYNARVFENVRRGLLPLEMLGSPYDPVKPSLRERIVLRFESKRLPQKQLRELEKLNELVEAAKLTGHARRERIAEWERAWRGAEPSSRDSDSTAGFLRFFDADDQSRSQLLCASVGIACERFRQAEGRWPMILTEIPPSILPTFPEDPYTGKRLLYRVLDDGAVVYVTGPGGNDDGGTDLARLATHGGSRNIGFRLWNPESRRRPALPRPAEPEFINDDVLFPGPETP